MSQFHRVRALVQWFKNTVGKSHSTHVLHRPDSELRYIYHVVFPEWEVAAEQVPVETDTFTNDLEDLLVVQVLGLALPYEDSHWSLCLRIII